MYTRMCLRIGIVGAAIFSIFSIGLFAQELNPSDVTRRNRERFELKVDSAIAAAEKRYFSLKASLELDSSDVKMAAKDLAEALFDENLRDFRARGKVDAFQMKMIDDLEKFIGKPADPLRLQMLDELQKALIEELENIRNQTSEQRGEVYHSSRKRQRNQAIGAGVGSVAALNVLVIVIYVAWKKFIQPFPNHYRNFLDFLNRIKDRIFWRAKLIKAWKQKNESAMQTCRDHLASIKKPVRKREKRERFSFWKFASKAGFWLAIDAVVASGAAWAYHYFFYSPLRAWDAQEDFITETFDEFALSQKRFAPNDKTNP